MGSAFTWLAAVAAAVAVIWKSPDLVARSGARMLGRLSLVASVAVFIMLWTGLFTALAGISEFRQLWETNYGLVLVAKLCLAMPLFALAAYNALVTRPELEEAYGRQQTHDTGSRLRKAAAVSVQAGSRRLVRFAGAEVLVGLLVVGAAATLTQVTPGDGVPLAARGVEPYEATAAAGDTTVELRAEPYRTGVNEFTARVLDEAGNPLTDVIAISAVFRFLDDQTVGPASADFAQSQAGVWTASGPYLPLEGQWRAELTVRRPQVDDTTAFFALVPAGPAFPIPEERGGMFANPAPQLDWNLVALWLLPVALGLFLWRRQIGRLGKTARRVSSITSGAAFALAIVLAFGVHPSDEPGIAGGLTNPVFPDERSVTEGQMLFEANCIRCHGPLGQGDGPDAAGLDPAPVDLTVHVPLHSDAAIYTWITSGIPGTAMPAFEEQLTDEQRWSLVNYLRTLQPVNR
jgi:copper transport protein